MPGQEWNDVDIVATFEVYVQIRDKGIDATAAIGQLAQRLGRKVSAVHAAVMAPASEDPLWNGPRPHRSLSQQAHRLWIRFNARFLGTSAGAVTRRRPQVKEITADHVSTQPPEIADARSADPVDSSSANYDRALEFSADQYIGHLRAALKTRLHSSTERVVRAALETTEAALAKRGSLDASQVTLALADVKRALLEDSAAPELLLNECTPGLGTRRPRVVFVGKEAAYDASEPLNFMLESIALSALWLAEPVSRRLLGVMLASSNHQHDFLRDPESLYPKVSAGHNWRKVARTLAYVAHGAERGAVWGDSAHLVELCAVPSRQHKGRAPSARRVEFLKKLFVGFANDGVRTIILHSQEPHHDEAQRAVAASFLAIPIDALPKVRRIARSGATNKDRIEHWDVDGRRVVRCRNLSNALPDTLLADIAALVH